jgi:hypothetical protein
VAAEILGSIPDWRILCNSIQTGKFWPGAEGFDKEGLLTNPGHCPPIGLIVRETVFNSNPLVELFDLLKLKYC